MKRNVALVLLVCAVWTAGCGSFTPALKKGEEVPSGTVLVMGKFVIEPAWYLQDKKAKPDEEELMIMVGMTNDLSREVKENSIYSPDMAIEPELYSVFFYAFPPGPKYIRTGQVMKPIGQHMSGSFAGTPVYDVLKLYRNIKLDIPANAKAVYIGTVIYKHDGKRITSVSVHDDYGEAVRALAKMGITGVKSQDVVKRLAVVLK